ncbi:hypothetical protein B0H13DRAFT_1914259 [Mycena leptocephala]|nr:hypothetical protein B0H13DRAFT_1914259 [Mycena leptocephala]
MDHQQRISSLERQHEQDALLIKDLSDARSQLEKDVQDLDNENQQLLVRVDMIEDTLEQQNKTLDQIFAYLENNNVDLRSVDDGEDSKVSKMKRDNPLNVCLSFSKLSPTY